MASIRFIVVPILLHGIEIYLFRIWSLLIVCQKLQKKILAILFGPKMTLNAKTKLLLELHGYIWMLFLVRVPSIHDYYPPTKYLTSTTFWLKLHMPHNCSNHSAKARILFAISGLKSCVNSICIATVAFPTTLTHYIQSNLFVRLWASTLHHIIFYCHF